MLFIDELAALDPREVFAADPEPENDDPGDDWDLDDDVNGDEDDEDDLDNDD